jgi:putative ABC transport system ATP-binding protein
MSETAKSKMRLNNFGFVFQSFYLISSLNVYDNICVPVIGNGDTVDREFVTELIEALHLSERIHHLPSQLSGGEKQRVAIARALVNRPSVIFADEPSGNLDSVNGNVVFELLFDLADKYDQTLIYVTHDSEKAKLAERIITMKDGMVVNDEKK